MLPPNLRLGDDQLQRVTVIGLGDRVLENTDGLEQVAGHGGLAGEVGRVCEDLLCLGGKVHGLGSVVSVLHRRLDTRDLSAVVIEHLIDVGVEHVGTAVNGGQTGEALRELTQTVERVDVWRLAVPGHRVHVQTDAVDSLGGLTNLVDVVIGLVQSHRVTDKLTGIVFETELVINVLHRARADVQTCI